MDTFFDFIMCVMCVFFVVIVIFLGCVVLSTTDRKCHGSTAHYITKVFNIEIKRSIKEMDTWCN